MTTTKEIESAIIKLPPQEFRKLKDWIDDYDADLWDKEIEEDSKSGKLDKIKDQVLKDIENGNYTEL